MPPPTASKMWYEMIIWQFSKPSAPKVAQWRGHERHGNTLPLVFGLPYRLRLDHALWICWPWHSRNFLSNFLPEIKFMMNTYHPEPCQHFLPAEQTGRNKFAQPEFHGHVSLHNRCFTLKKVPRCPKEQGAMETREKVQCLPHVRWHQIIVPLSRETKTAHEPNPSWHPSKKTCTTGRKNKCALLWWRTNPTYPHIISVDCCAQFRWTFSGNQQYATARTSVHAIVGNKHVLVRIEVRHPWQHYMLSVALMCQHTLEQNATQLPLRGMR